VRAEERGMNSLYEVIRSRIDDILEGEAISSWEVLSNGNEQCSVITERFIVIFYLDRRGDFVTSNIRYLDIPDIYSENIPFYTISQVLPYFITDNSIDIDMERSSRTIEEEISRVRTILKGIREHKISPRDLFFFFAGHCAGYTRSHK
jgi:hypothetical protein